MNPEVGVEHIAVEDVLTVLTVGLQVGGLNFLANELDVAWRQVLLEKAQIALTDLIGELLLLDLLLQHVKQMHRVGGDFGGVEVKYLGQNLEGKAGREAVHAFVDACGIAVFLDRLGLGVGVFQVLAVIDAHFGVDAGVFRLLEARQGSELGQHFQRIRRAVGVG